MLSRLGFGKSAGAGVSASAGAGANADANVSVSVRTLKSAEFRSAMEHSMSKQLIDVREPVEYKNGFIPGAINIPLSQIEQRMGNIPRDRDLFIYCRSGMRSKNAARILRKHGYTRLVNLQGGISSWSGKLNRR